MAADDINKTAHLFQRLFVTAQYFNRVSFRCSFSATVYEDEENI